MKLTTIALAAAFTLLSSTFASAYYSHHRYRAGARTYYAGHYYGHRYRGSYGRYRGGYYGGPNNRGGLVGGSDAGTYRP